ncbi:HlyD family secretion protein [Solidesulfovibrio sp. C21]|uniref:HlyD family secretion protein n=1 Tax=Solidesulfovibrio sp. C21 TaxID=3398613 RepID=UPI0039FC9F16
MKLRSWKVLLTTVVVVAALGMVVFKYRQYMLDPWTRDGKVRANVVQIAPRVSGPIVRLPVIDNQFVHKGDVLFEIDPRTYQAALDQARANLDKTRDEIKNLEAQVKSAEAALEQSRTTVRNASFGVTSAKAHSEEVHKDLGRNKTLVDNGTIARRDYDLSQESAITAQAALNQAETQLDKAGAAKLQASAELAQAKAALGAPGENNPHLREAVAQWEQAKLNFEFTKVRAPVDGYVTNLNLRLGSQAVANQPLLALVDAGSFWVAGYFRETVINNIRKGDKAVVTLMSYPETPLTGVVESIGQGITQEDGSSGQDLLPTISPTFEWIRLAQRVPVRVHITKKPQEVALRVGTTASVLVLTK